MRQEQNSIDGIVESILNSGEATKQKVIGGLKGIDNPFDRLDYLNQILSYSNLGLRTVKFESSLTSLVLDLQKQEIAEARRLADLDGLTGIYNRRHIEENMRKPKNKYCILMMDIDHFKKINDTYGHTIGDVVLQNVVKIIKENTRESYFGRYGGEEFYIELNQTDKEGGFFVADRVREAVKRKCISYVIRDLQQKGIKFSKELKNIGISLSIGVADEQQGKSPYDVRTNADKELYYAKQQGRDRVSVFNPKFVARE